MTGLRVGIVGLGAQMQENLLPTLLQMPDIRIVAVCDSDRTRAEQINRFVSNVMITDSFDEMLASARLDAVVMACPPQAHRDLSFKAMAKGVHVFVEKPPCFTLDELEALIAASNDAKVVTGVGMNFKFAKPMQQLRKMTSTEQFGQTVHVQLNHYASKPTSPLWGLDSTLRSFLLAQAIHTIDLGVTFGGGELRDIESRVQRHGDSLLVSLELQFTTGASVSLLSGTLFPYFEFDMKIVSSNSMMVELNNLWNITMHEPEHGTSATGTAKRWRGAWQPGPLDSGYERSGYFGELEKFFHAVRTNTAFEASFESLRPTYKVIESICDAAEQNLALSA
ncbi:Gfo/Idh/MocA family oxidoreductase [Pseudomonas cichorii]|uniref:Gfo/Idh/MocA family protein n=1 Tax=Pseudomonas syringae group TaxID=136849 RepID=UPI0018E65AB3|nr:Gfo/Idh/MocA family oxidoreductase [Pseudomonas cichorii]MBI6854942.1 Gfo/Idh/MocA family oxidoreductase [Pseudomonas cichorii]MBX8485638.1 Gfo/Idh/MocA family oxidoreductase [Pseudomonas cichorii]MBX8490684.1 Gfo/Idh/MocA family oxidoreductase [Pseudomonas cichorii]MBX8510925.1 Gfo/Idh/MocA family oxidoreductase [Pseudomonas cichorii]MBX8525758.1 Gfo/Idh/MocA family oxidoreductase [Pseudomonas cichorii]